LDSAAHLWTEGETGAQAANNHLEGRQRPSKPLESHLEVVLLLVSLNSLPGSPVSYVWRSYAPSCCHIAPQPISRTRIPSPHQFTFFPIRYLLYSSCVEYPTQAQTAAAKPRTFYPHHACLGNIHLRYQPHSLVIPRTC
jgi:hypothetical protein